MTTARLQCSKIVRGDCSPDLQVNPGEDVGWILTVSNPTTTTEVIKVEDALPTIILTAADTLVTATYGGGATGSAPTALPFTDTVTLPPGGKVIYNITATVPDDAPCGAQITNVACISDADQGKCCDERKFVTAKTVTVLPDDRECNPECIFPPAPNGTRPVDQRQIAFSFFGGLDEKDAQYVQDALSAGFNVASFLRWAVGEGFSLNKKGKKK